MDWEITIGIDLAITAKHVAAGCNQRGEFINSKPFRFNQTLNNYQRLIKTFVPKEMDPKKVLFLMEATGNVWLPLTTFLKSHGFVVSLVRTQRSSDLRKCLYKNVKSDFNDAKTLAKFPFMDSESLYPYVLSKRDIFILDRLTKQHSKLGKDIARGKSRIQASFQLCNPQLIKNFGDHKFTECNIYFFKNYSNPFKVKEKSREQFKKILLDNIHGLEDPKVIDYMYDFSIQHCNFLEDMQSRIDSLPFDLDTLQDEISQELRHIDFLEKERSILKKEINKVYAEIDPDKVLQSFKGIGEIIAPIIMAAVGNFEKFPTLNKMKAYLGFVPRKKQSGGTDRKGLKIVKTGRNLFKESLYLAAHVARLWDVEFAHKYKVLIDRGLHHKQATCALANKLLARVYSIMKRRAELLAEGKIEEAKNIHYQLRDLNGNEITAAQAREIIRRDYPSKKKAAQKTKQKRGESQAIGTRQSKDSSKSLKAIPPQDKNSVSKRYENVKKLSTELLEI